MVIILYVRSILVSVKPTYHSLAQNPLILVEPRQPPDPHISPIPLEWALNPSIRDSYAVPDIAKPTMPIASTKVMLWTVPLRAYVQS